MTITFHPTSSSGLLFFTSFAETEFHDYFSLALVNGYLEFKYNLGSGSVVIRSAALIEVDAWHTVTATQSTGTGMLIVDNQPPIAGASPPPFTSLNTQNRVWLGGYESFINLDSITGTVAGFVGCVSSLTIDSLDVALIQEADFGSNVAQCDTGSCAGGPCLNGGTCLVEGTSFVCQCPPEFTGSLCGYPSNPCSATPCYNGGICQVSGDSVGTCLCLLGFTGPTCDASMLLMKELIIHKV